MGRMLVMTWLAAHRDKIPRGAWDRRRDEWTPQVSAAAWERDLRARDAAPDQTRTCNLIAEEQPGTIIGIAMGSAAKSDPDGRSVRSRHCTSTPATNATGCGERYCTTWQPA